ncbi:MAG: hypothetical protein IPN34_27165 [Planctomycetes bacterium]|nr:hypothetical protein [Planctomycetota bacterium]
MNLATRYASETLEFAAVLERWVERAVTPLGRVRLARAQPYPDGAASRAAQARAARLLALLRRGESAPLGATRDLAEPFARARRGGAPFDPEELAAVRDFLDTVQTLVQWFEEPGREAHEFLALIAELDPLSGLRDDLDESIDEHGRVRDEASTHLSSLRRDARELRREIDAKVHAVLQRPDVRRALQEDRVRFRDGRPLLAVKRDRRGSVPGVVHDYSHTGNTAFVEPEEAIELGDRLRRVVLEEQREISRILVAFTQRLFRHQATLLRDLEIAAEIELAHVSAAHVAAGAAVIPRLSEDMHLDLRRARHPLLEERLREEGRLDALVPLDLHLGQDFDLLLITGPNTGGKTVAMKTAGLCALLAASGLPIPANEGSSVPFYEAIFADIGDEQGIAQNLSTFSSHLARIQTALDGASPRTLLLLDELGAGTDPHEGAALGGALLEVLLERRIPTLASTHLGALKACAYRHPRAENASVEFDAASLMPLYRLVIGLPGESNALRIARRLGLDENVLRRAAALLERREDGLSEVLEEVRVARTEAESARSRAKDLEGRRELELDAAAGARREAEELRRIVSAEADRVVEESFRRVLDELERFVPHLGSFRPAERERIEQLLAALRVAMRATPLGVRRREFLESLKQGDWVYVPRLRQRCAVRRVDPKREELTLLAKGMQVTLSFEEVTWFETL